MAPWRGERMAGGDGKPRTEGNRKRAKNGKKGGRGKQRRRPNTAVTEGQPMRTPMLVPMTSSREEVESWNVKPNVTEHAQMDAHKTGAIMPPPRGIDLRIR